MRRLVGWISGALGGITAYRLLRRRPQVEAERSPEPVPPEPDGRADELRAKLADSRSAEPEEAAEQESPEERRRRVHEEGRAAIDELKSDGGA